MYFVHSPPIWRDHPDLVAGLLHATGITADADMSAATAQFEAKALQRLAQTSEGDLPEVQAWRRAFSRMGLKPTQYRCASESLLRRLRKEGALPRLHPLIDLCNAASVAFAIPIGVLDTNRIAGGISVVHAKGDEVYDAFSGETENPDAGETIFVDEANRAHARRWTHRQSAYSAVRERTREVLIVAEAMHATAAEDVTRLMDALAGVLRIEKSSLLTAPGSRFDF